MTMYGRSPVAEPLSLTRSEAHDVAGRSPAPPGQYQVNSAVVPGDTQFSGPGHRRGTTLTIAYGVEQADRKAYASVELAFIFLLRACTFSFSLSRLRSSLSSPELTWWVSGKSSGAPTYID
jgi:hypothetical protein